MKFLSLVVLVVVLPVYCNYFIVLYSVYCTYKILIISISNSTTCVL